MTRIVGLFMSYPGLNHVTEKYGQISSVSAIILILVNIHVYKYYSRLVFNHLLLYIFDSK